VVVEIGAKLAGLGVKIGQNCGTGLLKLAGLQHLQQIIQGQLPQPNMDAQLLSTLHPTAAVGGLPAASARRFIIQHEPLTRGLYAGCCGYFSSARSELAVTIRSAMVDFPQLTLFAGAGIVPQSDPELEWQELDQKIALPLSLLDPSGINSSSTSVPSSSHSSDHSSDQPPYHSPTTRSQGMHVIRSSRLR
jgi:menaquinone-specific isochorismate synthase